MINPDTQIFAVFGNPVAHSLSPLMQNGAFKETGYNGIYLPFLVKDINSAIAGVKALNICGVSITIPHKRTVMEFIDEIEDTALRIGAVNTIVNRGGFIKGFNTDCPGAVKALKDKSPIKGKEVVLIGAGGAARAIGYGVSTEGGKLTILNRTLKKGEKLAEDLNAEFRPISELEKLKCEILVNATSLGMSPFTETCPVGEKFLQKDMIVMDIVYNPVKTLLLKNAKRNGCITIDGASMFVFQGALQFELWTREKAPLKFMRETVMKELKKRPDKTG